MIETKFLTNGNGRVNMHDKSSLTPTQSLSQAECKVLFSNGAEDIILKNGMPKADIITTAKIAGIQAAKKHQT